MSEDQQVTAVRVANVPEPEFEAAVESDKPLTVTALAEQGKSSQSKPLVDLEGIDPQDYARATKGPGAVQRWSLPSQYQAADARPAYTDESLAHMFRTGVDSAGNQIMNIMPRYELADDDMAVLIHYLKDIQIVDMK